MTQPRPDPVAAADAEARQLAQALLRDCSHAALAWTDPATQTPGISRIAYGLDPRGFPLTLMSALAPHFAALRAHPDCALMLGDPGAKGDPLTHPRLMLRARARFVAADDPGRAALRAHWLKGHPKAALYVDFADFAFVHLQPLSALLNAGFAKAYRLTPDDLCAAPL
jgi:putative heme iron utilization protein